MSLSYKVDLVETVDEDFYVRVIFQDTVKYTTIVDDAFSLDRADATPGNVPLIAIDIAKDYNSVSRELRLYSQEDLEPNTEYALSISGLVNVAGATIPDDALTFTTGAGTVEITVPAPPNITVEDHTFHTELFGPGSSIATVIEPLAILSVDPPEGAVYLDPDYNDGVMAITFSAMPSTAYLNPAYFKVQKKKIQRQPSRWTTVDALIIGDSGTNTVYLQLPSTDSTPVYDTPGSTYFEESYKYRVIVSQVVST